jgi:hypothetical protein
MFKFSNILLIQFKFNKPKNNNTAYVKLRKIQKKDRSHNNTQNEMSLNLEKKLILN